MYSVVPITAGDGPAIGSLNIHAFWSNSSWRLMWPNRTLEYVSDQAAKRTEYNLLRNNGTWRHEKVVDSISKVVVGYARWVLPEAEEEARSDTDVANGNGIGPVNPKNIWSEAQVVAANDNEYVKAKEAFASADWEYDHSLDVLDERIDELRQKLISGKKYLYLSHLAVHPDYHRRGIGTALVESGLAKASELGFDVFLQAKKAGLGVYKKAGFKMVGQIVQDDSKYGGDGEYGAYFLVWSSH